MGIETEIEDGKDKLRELVEKYYGIELYTKLVNEYNYQEEFVEAISKNNEY